MFNFSKLSRQEIVILVIGGVILLIVAVFLMTTPDKFGKKEKMPKSTSSLARKGQLNTPRDLAVSGDGYIYVVDSKNNRIQKFDGNGNAKMMFGKGGETNGALKEPCGIDIGKDGNIYVADTWNGRVQVFDKNGKFLKAFGKERGMWGPRDLCVDKNLNVYVADTGNCKIEKFDKDGRHIATFGKRGSGNMEFQEPFGMQEGPDGNIYIADRKNFRIVVMNPDGVFVRTFKVDGWAEPQIVEGCLMEPYFTIDAQRGYIYITDSPKHRILRYTIQGKLSKVIETDANGNKLINCPVSVVSLGGGRIMATDSATGKLIAYTDAD